MQWPSTTWANYSPQSGDRDMSLNPLVACTFGTPINFCPLHTPRKIHAMPLKRRLHLNRHPSTPPPPPPPPRQDPECSSLSYNTLLRSQSFYKNFCTRLLNVTTFHQAWPIIFFFLVQYPMWLLDSTLSFFLKLATILWFCFPLHELSMRDE